MSQEQLETMRHSAAHLMAAAVQSLFFEAKFGVGPTIENGFYYDMELPRSLTPLDLQKIEKRMKDLQQQKIPFVREEMSIDEAIKFFESLGQKYKVELLNDLKKFGTTKLKDVKESEIIATNDKKATVYKTGKFVDLCRGPHLATTKEVGAFKIWKLAGAYWRGDQAREQLQRVYGLAFETQKELENYLKLLEEAEKRDHRKIGKEMELFVFSDLVGPGLPLYTFKGATVRREIINYTNELQKDIGYQEVHTPNMNKADLFKVSGHYEKYKEDMFRVVSNHSEEEYFLKPMNCPQHTQIYASQMRSYKDLPLRIADFSNLYRDEKPGELSGLTRLRCFCQDDGHCFCREDQIKNEFSAVLQVIKKAMTTYGMDYKIRLSLWDPQHPEKYLGDTEVWEKSQKLLEDILIENKIEYSKAEGEAAIYGPKMDLISNDSLGRKWQISTIQLDFIMPQRFKLTYIDSDGKEKTPVMIHRAVVGSPERFLGILIEHYAGAFPTWLAPVQVALLPVGQGHIKSAEKLAGVLGGAGIRVEVYSLNETVGYKIRKAEKQKVPYMLVLGDKEVGKAKEIKTLMVRVRGQADLLKISTKKFIERMKEEIASRS